MYFSDFYLYFFDFENLFLATLLWPRPRDRAFCQLLCWSESILGVAERRIEHQALTLSPTLIQLCIVFLLCIVRVFLLNFALYFFSALCVHFLAPTTVYLWHYLGIAVTFVIPGHRHRHDFDPKSIIWGDAWSIDKVFWSRWWGDHFLIICLNVLFGASYVLWWEDNF